MIGRVPESPRAIFAAGDDVIQHESLGSFSHSNPLMAPVMDLTKKS
jgi:hypothetical protein